MKFTLDSLVLEKHGVTMQQFSVLLYYMSGGTGVLNEALCSELREDGFLKKVKDGYQFHEGKISNVRTWIAESNNSVSELDRLTRIAKEMQEAFPEGRRDNKYYWRDSTKVIAQRLAKFISKYGDYEDDKFTKAAKDYVSSFNGNYEFMQLLKYFIYKKDSSGEENSQLSSYLDNEGKESLQDRDWTTNVV